MDPTYGQINQFAFNYAPVGWLLCDGTTLSISGNEALYSLIGIRFGGNGTTNFQIPNMTNSSLFSSHMRYYIANTGIYPSRS